MQKKELKQIENLLLARKNVLLKEVDERFRKYKNANNEKLTDIAEIASSVLNDDIEMIVAEEGSRELKQIEDALARIRAGNYGVCEQCGQPIKKARLKAIPFTTLCVSCKEDEERECGERHSSLEYDWESVARNSENGDKDDINAYAGRKLIEREIDDRKN